jgi:CheY-like chemotaxis protein
VARLAPASLLPLLLLGAAVATQGPAQGTAVVERPTFTIAIHRDSAPFASIDPAGLPVGFAVELLQAIEGFRRGAFRVVLMDCRMPEMDGFEATRRIRAIERERMAIDPSYRSALIIAVTGDAIASTRKLCLEAGMDDYLNKPVSLESLALALSASAASS